MRHQNLRNIWGTKPGNPLPSIRDFAGKIFTWTGTYFTSDRIILKSKIKVIESNYRQLITPHHTQDCRCLQNNQGGEERISDRVSRCQVQESGESGKENRKEGNSKAHVWLWVQEYVSVIPSILPLILICCVIDPKDVYSLQNLLLMLYISYFQFYSQFPYHCIIILPS